MTIHRLTPLDCARRSDFSRRHLFCFYLGDYEPTMYTSSIENLLRIHSYTLVYVNEIFCNVLSKILRTLSYDPGNPVDHSRSENTWPM